MKKDLAERVLIHHYVDKPQDGQGGIISIRDMAELGLGIVCVHDSLDEFDIFYDVDSWNLVDHNDGKYGCMLESAREGIAQYEQMKNDYGMVCIVQDRWDPLSIQRKSSISKAHDAVKGLLESKNLEAYLYRVPIIKSIVGLN